MKMYYTIIINFSHLSGIMFIPFTQQILTFWVQENSDLLKNFKVLKNVLMAKLNNSHKKSMLWVRGR